MTMFTRAVITKAAVNEVVRTGIAAKFRNTSSTRRTRSFRAMSR